MRQKRFRLAVTTSQLRASHQLCDPRAVYRQVSFGQTLKKRGLERRRHASKPDGIEADINQMIAGWLAEPTPVAAMRLEGEALNRLSLPGMAATQDTLSCLFRVVVLTLRIRQS